MNARLLSQADRPFVACLFALMLLGLYNLASAGKPLGAQLHFTHSVHLLLGLAVALAVVSIPYRHLEGLAYPIFAGVIGLLIATSTFGKVVNGSRRWLDLGPLNLQTSDLAKLGVIVVVARTLQGVRWEGGGLRLQDIFRPLNVSRPVVLLTAVLVLSMMGDSVRPPKMERKVRNRFRPTLTLRTSVSAVALGRNTMPPPGARSIRLRETGVEGLHASLRREGGQWVLVDASGPGETRVNDLPITKPTVLHNGDLIQLGASPNAVLKFSNSLEWAKPFLPWVALLGVLWLGLSLRVQWLKGKWEFDDVVAPVDVVFLPCALILSQPDLGTTLVVLLIAFSMILYVGMRSSALLVLIGGGLAFGAFAWRFVLEAYQRERVLNFLNPKGDLAGAGYHQHQSLIAVGSGELLGKGHGQGTQTQLSFLPEQHTDFILSVWAEEHGFLGTAAVVVLFAGLILSALRVGQRARDRFGALLAVGVTAMIFWHTIVNMLMVLRLAPVVGVPLPLWSNGGSFVITTMVGVGLVLNVSMRRNLF